jgi:selenocysteine lyase/cysteine desulfurase
MEPESSFWASGWPISRANSCLAGRIRLSFHLYNTMEDVELVLSVLR